MSSCRRDMRMPMIVPPRSICVVMVKWHLALPILVLRISPWPHAPMCDQGEFLKRDYVVGVNSPARYDDTFPCEPSQQPRSPPPHRLAKDRYGGGRPFAER